MNELPTYRLVSAVFEGDNPFPVVVHMFYGHNEAQVKKLYVAHLKSDAFLRACKSSGRFSNFQCREKHHIETRFKGVNWFV